MIASGQQKKARLLAKWAKAAERDAAADFAQVFSSERTPEEWTVRLMICLQVGTTLAELATMERDDERR